MIYRALSFCLIAFIFLNISWVKKRNAEFNSAIGFLGIGFGVFAFCINPFVGAIIMVVSITSCFFRERRSRLWATSIAFFSSIALTLASLAPEVFMFRDARDKYPVESMSERLSYEKIHGNRGHTVALPQSTAERLERFEQINTPHWYDNPRRNTLEFIHKDLVQQFADNPGFGVLRMGLFSRPDLERIEINEERIDQLLDRSAWISETSSFDPIKSFPRSLYIFHDRNTLEFADQYSFGFAKNRDFVVGFRPHALRKPTSSLGLRKVELISLLKFGAPMVYQSEELPSMNLLKDAPTRSPDSFEEEALAQLQKGEDLVIQKPEQGMRVLGSLRAGTECMKCHDVERGELLGAFSYRFGTSGPK